MSAISALWPAGATRAPAATRATGTGPTRTWTAGTLAPRPRRTRLVGIGVEAAGIGVVGREARRIARMSVGARRTLALARTARSTIACTATAGTAFAAARAAAWSAACAGRTAGSRTSGPRTAGARFVAVRLARAPRAVWIAVPGRTGLDAVRHVPGTECGRIAGVVSGARLPIAARCALSRLARTLGLECLVDLFRGRFATDRQPAVLARAATSAATVFAHIVEATQFATFVRGAMAAHVTMRAVLATDVHRRLGRLALADHGLQRQCRRRAVLQPEFLAQRVDLFRRQFLRLAAQQRLRQLDHAIANAFEAADLAALRFPQAAHFAIAAFLEKDAEPVVGVRPADAFDLVELRRPVLERDATLQAVDELVGHVLLAFRSAYAAYVLALDLVRGMHHRVGKFAIRGEQQQAGGVDVQPTDRDPACAFQCRQCFEDRRAPFGILARGDFAFGLVVHQHAAGFGQRAGDKGAPVDLDLVAAGDAHAHLRDLAINLDQAIGDALLQRAARTQTRLRQHLVQAFLQPRGFGGGVAVALEGQRASLSSCVCARGSSAGASSEPAVEMSPIAIPSPALPSNCNCGSSSPMSLSSDSGGSSSRRLRPK